jgi:hypothetical protein
VASVPGVTSHLSVWILHRLLNLVLLVNFAKAPAYRPDLSLNAQLAHSQYAFRSNEEYVLINGTQYCSLIGLKYPPPSSLAMYLRRFYELPFPLLLRQSIGFCNKQKLYRGQDFNLPIALAPLKYRQ